MYEASCHKLDLKLFEMRVQFAEEDDLASSTNFDQKVGSEFHHQQQLARDKSIKQDELEQIEEELPLHLLQQNLQNADQVFRQMANRAFNLRHELEELVRISIFCTCMYMYMYIPCRLGIHQVIFCARSLVKISLCTCTCT